MHSFGLMIACLPVGYLTEFQTESKEQHGYAGLETWWDFYIKRCLIQYPVLPLLAPITFNPFLKGSNSPLFSVLYILTPFLGLLNHFHIRAYCTMPMCCFRTVTEVSWGLEYNLRLLATSVQRYRRRLNRKRDIFCWWRAKSIAFPFFNLSCCPYPTRGLWL